MLRLDMGKIIGIQGNWSAYFSTIIECGEIKKKRKNFKLNEHSWKNNYCGETLYSTKLPIIMVKTCTNTKLPIIMVETCTNTKLPITVVKPSTTLNFKLRMPEE